MTYLENIEILEIFKNRYVDIEGDSIQCTECNGINISSISISNNCLNPVDCFVDPCSTSNCYTHPEAECVLNYCGGGIAASLDAFVLLQLGCDDIEIYDNSMSEWATDDSLPIEI